MRPCFPFTLEPGSKNGGASRISLAYFARPLVRSIGIEESRREHRATDPVADTNRATPFVTELHHDQ
jgi:hypothetical protein